MKKLLTIIVALAVVAALLIGCSEGQGDCDHLDPLPDNPLHLHDGLGCHSTRYRH